MKRILLFDIDGTLTKSIYNKARNPILDAMSSIYEKEITKKGVIFSGGTDRSIIRDVLKANGIDYYSDIKKADQTVELYKKLLKENIDAGNVRWESLLNVKKLLSQCHRSGHFHLALVTGNVQEGAKMKLESAGIDPDLFLNDGELFGGFGSDHIDRLL